MDSKSQDLPETEITSIREHDLTLDKPPPDAIASDNATPVLQINDESEHKAEITEVPKKSDAQIMDTETEKLPQSANVVANDNTSPIILIDDETEPAMNNHSDSDNEEVAELTLPPIKDPRLQKALAEVDKKLHILTTAMRHSDLSNDPNTALHKMLEKNRELSGFKYPETRSVGFIGDSGAGKSSLINSLLDIKGMARSGGSGGACTCVATEFRYVDKDHPDPYTIEATFMNAKERSELLKELLQDYRTWRCDESRENVESADLPEERQRAKVAADRAWKMLEALFKSQSKFSQELLRSESKNSVSSILKKLDQWASAKITDDHRHLIVATDLDDCKRQLDNLTSGSQNDDESGLWLFLKLVGVYLDSPLLKTGVVLADLPGFRDTNQVRVRVTQRYLRDTCDEVFIVSSILRCCSDQSIQDILAGNPKHPRIVCTRSEDISAEEYSRGEDEFSSHVREKVRGIEDVQQQKRRATADKEKAADEDKRQYRDKESILREKQEKLALELKKFLIMHRNDFVIQDLQGRFDVLGVFCVSNSLYSGPPDDHSEAYMALSGIPELRRHCQRLITDSQMRATSDYLKSKMTIHLGSLRQWAMAASDDLAAIKTAELCRAMKEAKAFLNQEMTSEQSLVLRTQKGLDKLFQNEIMRLMRKCSDDWKNAWTETTTEWNKIFHGIYAALCRKNGVHTSKIDGARDWNQELGQCISDALEPAWETICREWRSSLTQLDHNVTVAFVDLTDRLQACDDGHGLAISHLIQAIVGPTEDEIFNHVDIFKKGVMREMASMQKRMLLHEKPNSFVQKSMRPIYEKCNAHRGVGSDDFRKKTMTDHFEAGGPFDTYYKSAEDFYKKKVTRMFTELHEIVKKECEETLMGIQQMTANEEEPAEAQLDRETARKILACLGTAEPELENAKEIFDSVKRDFEARGGATA